MLVLVAGAPGAGKTTFARRIAEDLAWPLLSKDAVKERLYDAIGFRSREGKVALGIAAMETLLYCAESILLAGGVAILESNFESRDREGLNALVARTGTRVATVRCEAEEGTLYRRFLARESDVSRHPGHRINTAYPADVPAAGEAPPSEEAFAHGIRQRGMRSFQLGTLLRVSTEGFEDMEEQVEEITHALRRIAWPKG